MPLPTDTLEKKLNISYGSDGLAIQGSYAIKSHVVVLADAAICRPGYMYWDFLYFKCDAAAGYYTGFSRHGRFECIGGLGYGSSKGAGDDGVVQESTQNIIIAGHYFNAFGQADMGWVYDHSEFGFGVRFNGLKSYGTYQALPDFGAMHSISYPVLLSLDRSFYFVEPGFKMAFGNKKIRWNINLGLSIPMGDYDKGLYYASISQNFVAATGLSLKL